MNLRTAVVATIYFGTLCQAQSPLLRFDPPLPLIKDTDGISGVPVTVSLLASTAQSVNVNFQPGDHAMVSDCNIQLSSTNRSRVIMLYPGKGVASTVGASTFDHKIKVSVSSTDITANGQVVDLPIRRQFIAKAYCRSNGDPNVLGFDNSWFSINEPGWFTYVQNDLTTIQMEHYYCGAEVFCNKAIAIRHGDQITVLNTTFPSSKLETTMVVNKAGGSYITWKESSPDAESKVFEFTLLDGTSVIVNANRMNIKYPYLNIGIHLPGSYSGRVRGLCGNFNGDMRDDPSSSSNWGEYRVTVNDMCAGFKCSARPYQFKQVCEPPKPVTTIITSTTLSSSVPVILSSTLRTTLPSSSNIKTISSTLSTPMTPSSSGKTISSAISTLVTSSNSIKTVSSTLSTPVTSSSSVKTVLSTPVMSASSMKTTLSTLSTPVTSSSVRPSTITVTSATLITTSSSTTTSSQPSPGSYISSSTSAPKNVNVTSSSLDSSVSSVPSYVVISTTTATLSASVVASLSATTLPSSRVGPSSILVSTTCTTTVDSSATLIESPMVASTAVLSAMTTTSLAAAVTTSPYQTVSAPSQSQVNSENSSLPSSTTTITFLKTLPTNSVMNATQTEVQEAPLHPTEVKKHCTSIFAGLKCNTMPMEFFIQSCASDGVHAESAVSFVKLAQDYLETFMLQCAAQTKQLAKSPVEADVKAAEETAKTLGIKVSPSEGAESFQPEIQCMNQGVVSDCGCKCPDDYSGAFCQIDNAIAATTIAENSRNLSSSAARLAASVPVVLLLAFLVL